MIDLPYPHKALWPNGRAHWLTKASQARVHRLWAKMTTAACKMSPPTVSQLTFTIYPKPRGPLPDKDNAVAALKSYIDGIADAYGANDRDWPVPHIQFGERSRYGRVVVTIE